MNSEAADLAGLIEHRIATVTNAAILRLFVPLVEQLRQQQHELDRLKAQLANGRDDKVQPVALESNPPRRRFPTMPRSRGLRR